MKKLLFIISLTFITLLLVGCKTHNGNDKNVQEENNIVDEKNNTNKLEENKKINIQKQETESNLKNFIINRNKSDKKESNHEFLLLLENLENDTLVFSINNEIVLPNKTRFIYKKNGETTQTEYQIKWIGKKLKDLKNKKIGEYTVYVRLSQDLKLNETNFGKITISVKVRVE